MRSQGIELQGAYDVDRRLTIHGSLELTDLKFTDYSNAECYNGQTEAEGCMNVGLPNASRNLTGARYGGPPASLDLGFTYDHPLAYGWSIGLTSDVIYNSRPPDFDNTPNLNTGPYTLLNASLRIYSDDGKMEAALTGSNLNDSRYLVWGQDKPLGVGGDEVAVLGTPRLVTLQLTRRF